MGTSICWFVIFVFVSLLFSSLFLLHFSLSGIGGRVENMHKTELLSESEELPMICIGSALYCVIVMIILCYNSW